MRRPLAPQLLRRQQPHIEPRRIDAVQRHEDVVGDAVELRQKRLDVLARRCKLARPVAADVIPRRYADDPRPRVPDRVLRQRPHAVHLAERRPPVRLFRRHRLDQLPDQPDPRPNGRVIRDQFIRGHGAQCTISCSTWDSRSRLSIRRRRIATSNQGTCSQRPLRASRCCVSTAARTFQSAASWAVNRPRARSSRTDSSCHPERT